MLFEHSRWLLMLATLWTFWGYMREIFNLETAVEREKAVEDIYVHREFKKLVVTFWVMKDFLNFLGA